MSWPTIRSGADMLRALVIGTGLVWSSRSSPSRWAMGWSSTPTGPMFSYAVRGAGRLGRFHLGTISPAALSVFFLTLLPAEA